MRPLDCVQQRSPHTNHSPPSSRLTTTPPGGECSSDSDIGSDISTLPDNACSGETWLITPPPCFTAGGNSPQHMEQSPLENLLIEHPSMSVYGPRLRQGSTGMDSDISESSTEADVQVHPANRPSTSGTSRRMVTVRSSPRKPRAVAARAGLATNIQTVKLSQAAEKRNNKRRLSSGQLSRSNMTRRVESRGKRQRQASFLLQPSARSSNKRC